ncbi:MAG: hypothetical protein V9F00_17795 [Nocardioides sp.]|jgi:hypothetical protein
MSRPRIPIGGYGEIAFLQRGKGKVETRTRFRDGTAGRASSRRPGRHGRRQRWR